MAILRHLLRPIDLTSLLLVAIFAVLFAFGIRARIYGILIIVLLTSWFFKYAYVLLDAVANGVKETPVLSVEMLNPVDEQRPAAQLCICALIGWLAVYVGGWGGVVVGIVGLLYLPASVAVLGVSARAIDAVNPMALTRTVVGLGSYYVLILGVIAVYAFILFVAAVVGIPTLLYIALTMFLTLSIFSGLGGALYERRHELGLDLTHAPEKAAERIDRERDSLRARALDDVYFQARGGNFMGARDSLLRWLNDAGVDALERDARFILKQASEWQDEKAFAFIARTLIMQLIQNGKTGTVVEVANGIVERAPTLPVGTPGETLKIATLARAAGRRALALRILTPFESQFPGDPNTAAVVALREQLDR